MLAVGGERNTNGNAAGVALGSYLPSYEVFIADDNHMLKNNSECRVLLRNAFFGFGLGSAELREAKGSTKCSERSPR